MEEENTKLLWHYTNADGFKGIIEKKQLWATKIQYLDDKSELQHAFDVAREVLLTGIYNESNVKGAFARDIFDFIDHVAGVNVFVFSFCYAKDLLSQWRGFSTGGGYAIGFNPAGMVNLAPKEGFELLPCIYNGEAQRELVEQWLTECLKRLDEKLKTTGTAETKRKFTKKEAWFAGELLAGIAPRFKNIKFEEEEEIRLISEFGSIQDKKINFRKKGNLLVPYYEFKLISESEGIRAEIEEVMVGPSLPEDLGADSVKMFLTRNGFTTTAVTHSEIPFRTRI